MERRASPWRIANTVLEIPDLHAPKLKRLSDAGIIDLALAPTDLEPAETQESVRNSALSV
jgi:hypothetical protein